MWKDRYEHAEAVADDLAKAIDQKRAELRLPRPPVRPSDKAPKAEHVEYGQRMAVWSAAAVAITREVDGYLDWVAHELERKPEGDPTEADDGTRQ